MTDSFLAKVISYSKSTKKAKIQPLVIMADGTQKKNLPLDAGVIDGLVPEEGDTVIILTTRNNLDKKEISIYFDATWSNGWIIGIISSNTLNLFKHVHIAPSGGGETGQPI